MEIMGGKMNKKERTITYQSKDCEHKNLVKIAPLWYACIGKDGCGKIFMMPISLQYSVELALEHLANVAGGIHKLKSKFELMRKKQEAKEALEEKEAIDKYKEEQKGEA